MFYQKHLLSRRLSVQRLRLGLVHFIADNELGGEDEWRVLHGGTITRSQCATLADKDLTDCRFVLAKSRKLAVGFLN